MKLNEFLENINLNDVVLNSDIILIKHDSLDMMLNGFGARIDGTDVVIVSGALISPNSDYENDFEIDAGLTAILDCTDNTPDILYWETENNETVALYNYLSYLGCTASYDELENLEIKISTNLYENAAFEEIFAA